MSARIPVACRSDLHALELFEMLVAFRKGLFLLSWWNSSIWPYYSQNHQRILVKWCYNRPKSKQEKKKRKLVHNSSRFCPSNLEWFWLFLLRCKKKDSHRGLLSWVYSDICIDKQILLDFLLMTGALRNSSRLWSSLPLSGSSLKPTSPVLPRAPAPPSRALLWSNVTDSISRNYPGWYARLCSAAMAFFFSPAVRQ